VQRPVAVSDGECFRHFNFHPEAGKMYLLEYSFMGPSICTLTCLVQSAGVGGETVNAPCSAMSYGLVVR
jgi:hypothetical protein